jgi:hypothetical protein
VKVLAARLGTKGWGWQSWGVGEAEEQRKYSGDEAVSRARGCRGVGHFLLGFSKRTHLAKSDPVSQICKLNLNQFHYRPE